MASSPSETQVHAPGVMQRALEAGISRRDLGRLFLMGAGGGITVVAGREVLTRIPRRSVYAAFAEYSAGFQPVSSERREELLGSIKEIPIPRLEAMPDNADGIVNVHFLVPPDTFVCAEFVGKNDPNVSLPVAKATFQGFGFYVPILQTEKHKSQKVVFGEAKQTVNTISVEKTEASSGGSTATGVKVRLFTPVGSRLFNSVIRCMPRLAMRQDNYLENTVTNDMPFFRNIVFSEHPDGRILVAVWEGYTKEEGGTEPQRLYTTTGTHRVYDYDISTVFTFTQDGKLLEVAHQEDANGRGHNIIIDRRFDQFHAPTPQMQPNYHSVGDHGMVRTGLEVLEGQEIRNVFVLYPDFSPGGDSPEALDLERGRKIVALREHRNFILRELNERQDLESGFDHAGLNQRIELLHFFDAKLAELHAAP